MERQGLTRKQLLGMAAFGASAAVLGGPAVTGGAPAAAAATTSTAADTAASAASAERNATIEDDIAWYDVAEWGVEGKGWNDTSRYYDRLPAKAEGTVRAAVWNLSRNSAGMLTRFRTDSPVIHARYTLHSPSLALAHMPATGVSGIDLYAQDARGRDRWLAVIKPTAQSVNARMVAGLDAGTRRYTAYLPLYNGVESVQIGVAKGAAFQAVRPRTERPVVFYGSSILQGACASRPGMAFTSILGRRFDRPTVNLGFSGNAFMDPEVGDLLAELDAEAFVIDALPNMEPDLVAERGEVFVRRLRAARPDTPIVMVEDRTYANAWLIEAERTRLAGSRAAYRRAYQNLLTSGVKQLTYLKGDDLLGDDDEATTDGSHPNDLGMVRYADAYTRVLRRVL
ncbi:SGNH/GDSL hydrolase family protein [Streptomyces sp. NPDC058045]|uniref:SGNH/GDSL hydrolase family protein n=1 Tax=Streptomyces sp. NPDC058045 TaxID=3346311 RepID=UPI0036EF84AE